MNKIITIIKKELKRFFSDKRMLATLILPGLLIFIIYALMGAFMGDAMSADEDHTYNVYVENVPDEYKPIFTPEGLKINIIEEIKEAEVIKQEIIDKKTDLYVIFEEDFMNKLEASKNDNTLAKPTISMFYNASSNESLALYQAISASFSLVSPEYDYNYLVNKDVNIKYDLATKEDMSAKIMTMMLPYLLIIFLFSGCLAVTSESIAGEKERGTINTLLVTPTKRSHIAFGKIFALSVTSLFSATSSFIGLMLSLPILMNSASGNVPGGAGGITISMYGVGSYFAIFAIILLTVILFTTILAIISTIAKSVKESSQLSSVVMIIVMLFGISSMVGMGNIPSNPFIYLLPIYNNVQCMSAIFALQFNAVNFVITIVSNMVYIVLGVWLLARMFNSEKIMSTH